MRVSVSAPHFVLLHHERCRSHIAIVSGTRTKMPSVATTELGVLRCHIDLVLQLSCRCTASRQLVLHIHPLIPSNQLVTEHAQGIRRVYELRPSSLTSTLCSTALHTAFCVGTVVISPPDRCFQRCSRRSQSSLSPTPTDRTVSQHIWFGTTEHSLLWVCRCGSCSCAPQVYPEVTRYNTVVHPFQPKR